MEVVKTFFHKFRADMQARTGRIQVVHNSKLARADGFCSEHVRLLVSGKSFKSQLVLQSEHSQEVEDLKYQLDGAVAKERLSQTVNKTFLRALTVRSVQC